jgi:alpha-ribazole phosphatase
MNLYLIRHPTPIVDVDKCYGSTDLAVDVEECERLLPILRNTLPEGAQVWSSPLIRCETLATMMATSQKNDAVKIDSRLRELHFGEWEMRSWSDIPREQIDAWANDTVHYRPGKGESVFEMATRVAAFYRELRFADQDAVVVCHAGTIRLIEACLSEGSIVAIAARAAASRNRCEYGGIVKLKPG